MTKNELAFQVVDQYFQMTSVNGAVGKSWQTLRAAVLGAPDHKLKAQVAECLNKGVSSDGYFYKMWPFAYYELRELSAD